MESIGSDRLSYCGAALPTGHGLPVPCGDAFHLGTVRSFAVAWIAGDHTVFI
jgi:hypothetical protein